MPSINWRHELRHTDYGLPTAPIGWLFYAATIVPSILLLRHKIDLVSLEWLYGFLGVSLLLGVAIGLPCYDFKPPRKLISGFIGMILSTVFVMTPAYLLAPREPQIAGLAQTLAWDQKTQTFHWTQGAPMIFGHNR
jgi:hypothetical protein